MAREDHEEAAGFRTAFGYEPGFRVAVPGRVVLIGDHIDYAGLAVMPMAIDRHVTVHAAGRRDDVIRLISTRSGFDPREFRIRDAPDPFVPGDWSNYARAAVRELALDSRSVNGFDACISSTVPVASGLSSSSAIVVAVAAAFLRANGMAVEPLGLADRMAAAERFVGTRGGGMDQAICVAAESGHAAVIHFDPLGIERVPIPDDWSFIIASSLERSAKSGAMRSAYNERVSDARDAHDRVAAALGLAGSSLSTLIATAGQEQLLTEARHLPAMLGRRLRHVVTEAARVIAGRSAMLGADATAFGRLMLESHESLRDDYDVSTDRLNAMVSIAMAAGAKGARLSGAGFGGCIVALAAGSASEDVCAALRAEFYDRLGVRPGTDDLFETRAADGLRVDSCP